jgi:hypothetical protein
LLSCRLKKQARLADNSIATSSNLKIKLKQKIDSLDVLVSQIDELFNTYPLTSEIRNRISKGKILLKEAEIVYNKGQYLQANRKLLIQSICLQNRTNLHQGNLKNYFKSYSVWKKWVTGL